MMVIKNEIKDAIDSKLEYYTAPGPRELNRQVTEFLQYNHGYGKKVTIDLVISYLRHNFTNWPKLQSRLQDWRIWSMTEHHDARDYVDELIWQRYETSIPWEIN